MTETEFLLWVRGPALQVASIIFILGIAARVLEILIIGRKRDLAALRELVRERAIGRAVVGVPLHMNGRRGPEAEAALRFAGELARSAGLEATRSWTDEKQLFCVQLMEAPAG